MSRRSTLLAILLVAGLSAWAPAATPRAEGTVRVFADDFERSEADDAVEEVGGGWSTNSATRANGHKQVDLRDGAMHVTCHPEADHAVSVRHDAAFTDGVVRARFMLPGERDSLGFNFADLKLKSVHAGHLCMVRISTDGLQIEDMKTGRMDAAVRQRRKDGVATPADQALLKSRKRSFPVALEAGRWYTLAVAIRGETMAVRIDGTEAGSFTSPGIAHPTKRTLRLSVPRAAVIDDIVVDAFGPN